MNPENQSQSERFEAREKELSYESIREELEGFLPFVGEQIMELRRIAKDDSEFTQLKADKTIVTKADKLAENLIREWIEKRFSNDSIRSEETKQKQGDSSHTWIIDPIDGTYNFNNFGNKFGISVGLVEDNMAKLGVIFYPAEDISISTSECAGALINGELLKASGGRTNLREVFIIASQHPIHLADPRFKKTGKQQISLLAETRYEELGWSYTVAFLKFLQTDTDAILHFGATPYDIAGACAIAKELKLEVSGYDGKSIDFSKDIIPIVISKNLELHKAIVRCLNPGN